MFIKKSMALAHMKVATVYSNLSKAKRLKVGALLTKGDSILSYGWNGMPAGFDDSLTEIDGVTNSLVVHAEMNVLKKLYNSNERAAGSVMYVTHCPCLKCSIDIVDAKIKAVIFKEPYRLLDGVKHLLNREVEVFQLTHDGSICRWYIDHDGDIESIPLRVPVRVIEIPD